MQFLQWWFGSSLMTLNLRRRINRCECFKSFILLSPLSPSAPPSDPPVCLVYLKVWYHAKGPDCHQGGWLRREVVQKKPGSSPVQSVPTKEKVRQVESATPVQIYGPRWKKRNDTLCLCHQRNGRMSAENADVGIVQTPHLDIYNTIMKQNRWWFTWPPARLGRSCGSVRDACRRLLARIASSRASGRAAPWSASGSS